MKICVAIGSRADAAPLDWPLKVLRDDPFFDVVTLDVSRGFYALPETDLLLVLGDRREIMEVVLRAHLRRLPIAHIAGGDVTEGSYDDAMRDAISRMASIHFVTSTSAMARLTHLGYRNVHLVGNPCIDFIRHADWKGPRPYEKPYVVVSYQPETIDGTNEIQRVLDMVHGRFTVFLMPNPDRGSEAIRHAINEYLMQTGEIRGTSIDHMPHEAFLNLIAHCEEFIGNSSSMLYEAPELLVKTHMIGKRQRGRVIPFGDGNASLRIAKILKYTAGTL